MRIPEFGFLVSLRDGLGAQASHTLSCYLLTNLPSHIAGVIVDGELIQADAVVLALGPWTNTLAGSLQLPHISGQLGHSLVLKPSTSEALPADCLFVSWQNKSGISAIENS